MARLTLPATRRLTFPLALKPTAQTQGVGGFFFTNKDGSLRLQDRAGARSLTTKSGMRIN